jgi:hypothetical protein
MISLIDGSALAPIPKKGEDFWDKNMLLKQLPGCFSDPTEPNREHS